MLNINGRFQQQERGPFQGPPDTWARQIAEIARDYGTSTFILAAGDPSMVELYGTVVAPLARELAGHTVARAG